MGPMTPTVKLTKFKKVSSMADMTQLEDLPEEERCSCASRVPCLDPTQCGSDNEYNNACNSDVEDYGLDTPGPRGEKGGPKDGGKSRSAVDKQTNFTNQGNREEEEEKDGGSSSNTNSETEGGASRSTSPGQSGALVGDVPTSPQTFRSGTLTRRSRRTSRELRSREHMAQCMGLQNGNITPGATTSLDMGNRTSVENAALTTLPLSDDRHAQPRKGGSSGDVERSQHKLLLDVIDGKISVSTIGGCNGTSKSQLCAMRSENIQDRVRTLDTSPLKGGVFSGIGPRGSARRHSIHSGYMTLPKMTGLVGLTLSDLKTRRKGENTASGPTGVAAFLDLKIFKTDHQPGNEIQSSSRRNLVSPGTPLPNRPSTISYSSRFRSSIGRRKSITSIENIFKSFRSISSPTPPVLEELDETSDTSITAKNSNSNYNSNNPARVFMKQFSTSSLRSTYSGSSSSSSSSCHSSPLPTPQLERKSGNNSSSVTASENNSSSPTVPSSSPAPGAEEPVLPLNLEQVLRLSEGELHKSPSVTLDLLKRHLSAGGAALEEPWGGDADPSVRALACALRLHLTQFTRRLHLARDTLDETARCYHLLDKTYEWALETMRAVGRVKMVGLASPEQVGTAAQSLASHARSHPPPSQDTFAKMADLATKLANATLVHQVKVAQSRCQETLALLQSRQAALVKARRQMEFDCQSFVDLNEVLDSDDSSPFSWLVGTPLNSSGRRRSITSVSSRTRESLSRCSSLDTDDDSVFPEMNHSISSGGSSVKQPLESRSSLGGIKEVRESAEELDREHHNSWSYTSSTLKPSSITNDSHSTNSDHMNNNPHPKLSSTHNTRELYSSLQISPIHNPAGLNMSSLPPTINNPSTNNSIRKRYLSSTESSNSSGSTSSCGSQGCTQVTITPQAANHKSIQRASAWPFGDALDESRIQAADGSSLLEDEDEEELLEGDSSVSSPERGAREGGGGGLLLPPSCANSHLLTRSSQLDISDGGLTEEEAKKNIKLHHIISELIKTEQDYVRSLEYIIENYIPELLRDDIPQALRGQRNVIFGNIEKIYEFHRGYFLKHLRQCEKKPLDIGRIFLKFERQFYLYALYNKNKPKSDTLMAEYGSLFFRTKQMLIGDKMDLASYLLKPVQRMGKYALLLTQLVKLSSGCDACPSLTEAQQMVQFQLRHGNDLLAMDSLKDCDVNLKEQGQLLRQAEFQVWEGARGRKTTRHVFLFEDLILFSKARKDPEKRNLDIFQYKHSMKMTDIGLTEQVDYNTKFEIWFRKRKPSDTYVLQASSMDVKEAWTEEISKLLWRQALKNRTLRLHEMSSMGIGNKPCLDIRPSEDQINDRSVSYKQASRARLESTMSNELASSTTSSNHVNGSMRRPYSIISVSSSSSNSSSQPSSSSCGGTQPFVAGTINLGFESGSSPRPLHRSVTRTSQCSAESGILADMYSADNEEGGHTHHNSHHSANHNHYRVERSNSTVTTVSVDSGLSPSTSMPTSPAIHGSSLVSSLASPSNLTNTTSYHNNSSLISANILSSLAAVTLFDEMSSKNVSEKLSSSSSCQSSDHPQSDSSSTVSSGCTSVSSSSSARSAASSSPSLPANNNDTCPSEAAQVPAAMLEVAPVKTLLTTEV